LSIPFETKPPRLKDLVNSYVMGEVWLRDSPLGPVTDSLTLAAKFSLQHSHVLRAIAKCEAELTQPKFNP
jgi:phage regulator Rha-like protein